MVQLFSKRVGVVSVTVFLWAFGLLGLNGYQAKAQTSLTYPGGEYRTASTGTISQNTGTALLEKLTSDGTWAAAAYPIPTDAMLHVGHTAQVTGALQLSNLMVQPGQIVTVAAGALLTSTGKITVSNSAQLLQIGTIESYGTLQLLANAKLRIQSSAYQATAALWAGIEEFDLTSEVQVENAQANAVLFNLANLTQQTFGFAFGKLTISFTGSSTQWQLTNGSGALANSATFQVPISSSLILAGVGSSVSFGQQVNLNGGTFYGQNQSTGTVTLAIAGNLVLQSSNFALNQASSANAITFVDLKGNLLVDAGSSINNSSTVNTSTSGIRLVGATWQEIAASGPLNHVSVAVKAGAMVRLAQNLLLNPANSVYAGTFSVENGATLDFGADATGQGFNIGGQGYFRLDQGGTLYITSAQGINATGAQGNVQVTDSRRTFNQVATFVYSGRVAQQTGNAFTTTSNGKIIVIDNPTSVTISHSTGITSNTALSSLGGRLEIKQGKLIGTATADISSSGRLVMSGGVYQISMVNTTVPLLTGNYELTGGHIELAGNGEQTLRGKTYLNVVIGGTNQSGVNAKTISTTTTINQNITILPNAILDVSNKSLKGDGGLTMTGGLLRIGKASGTLPELTGKNDVYNLTGGTIEFYGTLNGQSQSIRGTYGTSQKVTYHHLILGAAQANTSNDLGNQLLGANFDVTGTLTVQAPAVLQVASNRAIGGTGNFVLEPGSTLLYGSAQGIKLTGTGTTDGNIRVGGTRNFSSQASYGFIGNAEMVSGDGLPATVANLLVAKSGNGVTLTNSVAVSGIFTLKSGLFKTDTRELAVSNPSSEALQLADPSFYIQGNLRRAIGPSGLYAFPIGTAAGKRQLEIQSNGMAGNGFENILVSFKPLTHHQDQDLNVIENGFRYLQVFPEGVWHVSPNAQPTEGSYTAMASLQGFLNLTDNHFALLVRPLASVTAKDWTTGDGVLDGPNKEGRTVESGYAKRNFVAKFGQLGIATMEATLPVSWLFVKAAPSAKGTTISWATATETDNDRFEVEFSTDGKVFALAGTVAGNGNSTIAQQYQFQHNWASTGMVYYRIKQIDFDGSFEYSKVVASQPGKQAALQLQAYPNPSQEFLYLSGLLPAQPFSVEIWNVQGKLVERLVLSDEKAAIQVRHLPSGHYFLQVNQDGQMHRLRFVKQ